MRPRLAAFGIAAIVSSLLHPVLASSQARLTGADLLGTVTDQSGAAVPGATVTVTTPGTLGLAGLTWGATDHVIVLQPLGKTVMIFPSGSSVLTAASNDALIFTASAGTPTVAIGAIFG